jgi:hypothetical protein
LLLFPGCVVRLRELFAGAGCGILNKLASPKVKRWFDEIDGETPSMARGTRAVPFLMASIRLNISSDVYFYAFGDGARYRLR